MLHIGSMATNPPTYILEALPCYVKKGKIELCKGLLSTIAGVCACVTEQLVVAVIASCMQRQQKILCRHAYVRMEWITACL